MTRVLTSTMFEDDQGNVIVLSAAMSDAAYRSTAAVGGVIPQAINCPRCGLRAPFMDDRMAARYECPKGHAVAAMWADRAVAGKSAHGPATTEGGER
jgi:ribosomal protein S27AE